MLTTYTHYDRVIFIPSIGFIPLSTLLTLNFVILRQPRAHKTTNTLISSLLASNYRTLTERPPLQTMPILKPTPATNFGHLGNVKSMDNSPNSILGRKKTTTVSLGDWLAGSGAGSLAFKGPGPNVLLCFLQTLVFRVPRGCSVPFSPWYQFISNKREDGSWPEYILPTPRTQPSVALSPQHRIDIQTQIVYEHEHTHPQTQSTSDICVIPVAAFPDNSSQHNLEPLLLLDAVYELQLSPSIHGTCIAGQNRTVSYCSATRWQDAPKYSFPFLEPSLNPGARALRSKSSSTWSKASPYLCLTNNLGFISIIPSFVTSTEDMVPSSCQ
ncbi:hypothetical protein ACRALDRAFT_213539 [Sodiomyces alcalophilus JCM 7366]|uniref:uncharacterized protein n=1 Tax=Sodiomyces alcalophilus JCM 7366 TaxID=591952 RepID=UPI0039B517EB